MDKTIEQTAKIEVLTGLQNEAEELVTLAQIGKQLSFYCHSGNCISCPAKFTDRALYIEDFSVYDEDENDMHILRCPCECHKSEMD